MEQLIFKPAEAELSEVEKIFRNSLEPWWDELEIYVPRVGTETSYRAIPALVINAYHYLGLERELGIKMANMFKTIYFATRIHELIRDDDEGQEHSQELQFSILIGDYIFGRVLKLLLETNTEQLLAMFAAMICEINEGLIVKYTADKSLEDNLARTRAPFYGYAFRSAAQLGGFDQPEQEAYSQLGYELGMALELLGAGQVIMAAEYAERARIGLVGQDGLSLPGRSEMMGLIQDLEGNLRR